MANEYLDNLRKKKIAVLGFGEEGRALLAYLRAQKILPIVLDKNPGTLVDSDIPRRVGSRYLDALEDFDIVFRSPGVPLLLPQLPTAAARGVKISSATELFFELSPCPIIGVTGTKGKGTTALLVYTLLKSAGQAVFLGGNIGTAPLRFIDKLTADSLAVLELSSFQLQGLQRSPHVAIITNITADHLDYHKDIEEYRQAKSVIVVHQGVRDIAILNADDSSVAWLASETRAQKFWFSTTAVTEPGAYCLEEQLYLRLSGRDELICASGELKLLGRHNIQNVLAASLAARLLEVPLSVIRRVVVEFVGQPHHRLELVRVYRGVAYYNDSAATMPAATLAALQAFKQRKIIILGGSDKGANYEALAERLTAEDVGGVITLGHTGATLARLLKGRLGGGKLVENISGMQQAVAAAAKLAQNKDIVLLSPASASFGLFKNYQHRGDSFRQAVEALGRGEKKRE